MVALEESNIIKSDYGFLLISQSVLMETNNLSYTKLRYNRCHLFVDAKLEFFRYKHEMGHILKSVFNDQCGFCVRSLWGSHCPLSGLGLRV